MIPLLFAMPGNEKLATSLSDTLGYQVGDLELRHFPDDETYLRLRTSPTERSVAVVCTLDRPDAKLMPLTFAAATARDLGAARVGLVAPYLAYMRQDRRFKSGEAVTSREVARLLSHAFDWLVTVDPHLHRYSALGEIYTIATRVVHAAPLISGWIKANAPDALVIGPDSESEQWAAEVAGGAHVPYSVLSKVRRSDRDVEIRLGNLDRWQGRMPVLVDDIVASGGTMIEAARLLIAHGWPPPVCIAVHGLFSGDADAQLAQTAARIVTSNTVRHPTNGIDVGAALAGPVADLAGQ